MASIHFQRQHKRNVYWTYMENFLRVQQCTAFSCVLAWGVKHLDLSVSQNPAACSLLLKNSFKRLSNARV